MTDTENKANEIKPKNTYMQICMTQAVCIAVILIAVLIIKFFFKSGYEKAQKWYSKYILDETTVSEIFDGENDDEI